MCMRRPRSPELLHISVKVSPVFVYFYSPHKEMLREMTNGGVIDVFFIKHLTDDPGFFYIHHKNTVAFVFFVSFLLRTQD